MKKSSLLSIFFLRLALGVAAACLTSPQAFAGSEFYLTVERSFAPNETIRINLDFLEQTTPLTVRVLRPDTLDSFLDGQLKIRRSYEEPLTKINAGNYLAKGINALPNPLRTFRGALNESFRKTFSGEAFRNSLTDNKTSQIISPPQEMTIEAPKGFSIVRTTYLDLQKGGDTPSGLYDYGDWENGGRKYQVRTLGFDPLPEGIYLVQVVQGKNEAQVLLQVSSLSLQVKQSVHELLTRVIDRKGDPVSNASIRWRDSRGKWINGDQHTNEFGEVLHHDPEGFDGKLLVQAFTTDKRTALIDTDFLTTSGTPENVFLVTDRPIFKPGDTFSFKGILRHREGGNLFPPQNASSEKARISLIRSSGENTEVRQEASLNQFGSFSGSIDLAPYEAPGLYRIISEIEGKPYGGELRVKDYIKPTFYLDLIRRDPLIRPGEPFHIEFQAKRYSGGVPDGTKYEVFVYRKRFEAPEWKSDVGVSLDAGQDYSGEIRSLNALSQPQRLYSSVEFRLASQEEGGSFTNSWASAPEIAPDGHASIDLTLPKMKDEDVLQDWIYTVMVRALDPAGSFSVLSEDIPVSQSEGAVIARFTESVASEPNGKAHLALISTGLSGHPIGEGKGYLEGEFRKRDGTKKALNRVEFVTNGKGNAILALPLAGETGQLVVTPYLLSFGEKKFARPFMGQEATLLLPDPKGESVLADEAVQLFTNKTVLTPGESAKIYVALPPSFQGNHIWETRSGEKIFQTQSLAVTGKGQWIDLIAEPHYGTGFYETITTALPGGTYRENTIGFRIVPKEKQLSIQIAPEKQEVEPMKPTRIDFVVSDSQKRPRANAELSVSVVDRAVYAVQPEIRPTILEFFYPLPRLNLGTFYSDSLQGYGYADEIKNPNFQLSAIKSRVQPMKRNMRDTAGWFPHVVTDEDGKASVTVPMPANLTEWLVTAIAIDEEGRAGEAKSSFRSTSDVDVAAHTPEFLRAGDTVSGTLTLGNKQEVIQKISLQSDGKEGLAISGQASHDNIEIAPHSEKNVALTLQGTEASRKSILSLALTGNERLGGIREFEIPIQKDQILQRISSTIHKGNFSFSLPKEGVIEEVQISLVSGFLGGAISSIQKLISYPYGCSEQLVHSTLPNLVLVDLLSRSGLTDEQLKQLGVSSSLTRAKGYATTGIQKLLLNQKSDGSFSLWSSEKTGDYTVTALVDRALRYAAKFKIDGASLAHDRASEWIQNETIEQHRSGKSLIALSSVIQDTSLGYQLSEWIEEVIQQALEPNASIQEIVLALQALKSNSQNYGVTRILGKMPDVITNLEERLVTFLEKQSPGAVYRNVNLSEEPFLPGDALSLATIYRVLYKSPKFTDALETKIRQDLLGRLRDGWWGSTADTAGIILELLPVIEDEAKEVNRQRAPTREVSLGTNSYPLSAIPGGFLGTVPVQMQVNTFTPPKISLHPDEWASATLTVATKFAHVTPLNEGISVDRKIFRVTKEGRGLLKRQDTLHMGDTIVSEVTLHRNEKLPPGDPRSSLVVLSDPLPSFAEGVETDRTYLADAGIVAKDDTTWSSIKETLRFGDRMERIIELSPGATGIFYQVWRVAFPGDVALPPAKAFDMYNDSIQGNSDALELISQ